MARTRSDTQTFPQSEPPHSAVAPMSTPQQTKTAARTSPTKPSPARHTSSRHRRTVITYGTFDTLHHGHIRMLRRARALGDFLIVALSTDAFNAAKGKRALFSYEERKEDLEGIKYVDMIIQETCWDQKATDVAEYGVDVFSAMLSWSPLTWATVASMSLLGIMTSVTLKYADNIVRAFAAAGSIVLATLVSWAWFGHGLSAAFALGSMLTCSALALYYV